MIEQDFLVTTHHDATTFNQEVSCGAGEEPEEKNEEKLHIFTGEITDTTATASRGFPFLCLFLFLCTGSLTWRANQSDSACSISQKATEKRPSSPNYSHGRSLVAPTLVNSVVCWSELWLKVWFGVIFKFGEGSYCRRDNMFQRSVNTDSTRLKGQQLKKHFCLFFFPTCQSQILPVFSVKLQSFIIDTAVWDPTLVMMPPFIYTAPASTSEATVGRRFSSWLQDKDQIIKWSYNLLITRLVSLNYDDIICWLSNSSRTVRLWGCR